MTLQVYNTLTNRKEPFETVEPGMVRMYICGPTVYGSAHIGHALSYILFDAIRRYLEYKGYAVKHVQNFTDVDDKIIKRANETGESWDRLTRRYIDEFLGEMAALNVQPAHVYPFASQEMPWIISMIEGLLEEGYAYVRNGDVYFRVSRDEDYGKLSNRRLEEQQAGARIAVDEDKEHPADFALWKASKPGEPSWESPWGPGRPGWHIECSAMNLHHLGPQIDIHGGGTDLIFPHHENEIAQTESYTGQPPFARYWLHNGMLQMGGEKMARSVGNIISIRELLERTEPDAWRLFVLSSHYRRPVTYTSEAFGAAERGLERFKAALKPATDGGREDASGLLERARATRTAFEEAMDEDFNTAAALGILFELAKAINAARDAGQGGPAFEESKAILRELLSVLGFALEEREKSPSADAAPFIELLLETRSKLRQARQWTLADEIRDRLSDLGVKLEDTPGGTTWRMG
ncbi:MAG TPA: cysteine--tRNA ligase [Ardenticatenaceae bacterium]|nr:cysteine--tRNA ligase [Ardenticatenaceae bacterium]